ncbi:MAG: hydrolase [Patescibacteria group bacterium]|nr:hydrolase [Patescibacteria group bacterium]
MVAERFKETWWLRGGHAQTLWPVLTRRVRLNVRSERLELPDGDCVRLDWAGEAGPIVIVLPGLQGDLESAYVRGIMRACQSRGWRAVLLNYRGRGEPNRMVRSYHCGMTCDLHHFAQVLAQREPGTPVAVVGYSVGANICLKWLGECGERGESVPVIAGVGVSAPFQLGPVAKKIERGFSRVYQWYLLRSLRGDVARKREMMGAEVGITHGELRRLTTFFKFDDRISGPWNGFNGAEDYYAKTRSDVLLRHITVPTLIVNAHNDPLVPTQLHPRQSDLSDKVTLEITDGGGHMGFVSGRWPWSPQFWLDTRVPEFLAKFL